MARQLTISCLTRTKLAPSDLRMSSCESLVPGGRRPGLSLLQAPDGHFLSRESELSGTLILLRRAALLLLAPLNRGFLRPAAEDDVE